MTIGSVRKQATAAAIAHNKAVIPTRTGGSATLTIRVSPREKAASQVKREATLKAIRRSPAGSLW
jgi:hypothetical protein